MRLILLGAAAYLIIGIVTFGHAAAAADREVKLEKARCEQRGTAYCFDSTIPGATGLVAGSLWPFYWSWEIFE